MSSFFLVDIILWMFKAGLLNNAIGIDASLSGDGKLFIQCRSGALLFVNKNNIGINDPDAIRLSSDKGLTLRRLRGLGYSTLESKIIGLDERFKERLPEKMFGSIFNSFVKVSWPLVVKPGNGSLGIGVCLVSNMRELQTALQLIRALGFRSAIIEHLESVREYRAVVLNGVVQYVCMRQPPQITGDGIHSIKFLINIFIYENRIPTTYAFSYFRYIESLHYDVNSILKSGETIRLLFAANASAGGKLVDVTKQCSSFFVRTFESIGKDFGLKLVAIDFFANDVSDICCHDYKVVELNSTPGFFHYSRLSKEAKLSIIRLVNEAIK